MSERIKVVSAGLLATRLGVSRRQVQRWSTDGVIRPHARRKRGGKAMLYIESEVRAALAAHGWRGNQKARRRDESGTDSRACGACQRPFPLDHYPPSAGRSGGWVCRDCKEPSKRAHDVRRRRAKAAALVEHVSTLLVAQRDGWRCGICGKRVTRAHWSLDHVVPLSAGGAHAYANVVIAHRLCNSRRGVGRLPVQAALFAMPSAIGKPPGRATDVPPV